MRILPLLCLFAVGGPCLAQSGPVARFACDEGSGDVITDSVGGLTGTIHGATWVRSGDGYCLSFDGVDDAVDCQNPAALSPEQAVSLEVWVRPDKVPAAGEPGIAGKAYHNYALTYYGNGKVWWYVGDSTVHISAPVSPGSWHHVVGSSADGVLKLYVDGELAASGEGQAAKIPATEHFYLGTSAGDSKWTKNQTFSGLIDEVRVYDRPLSPAEIKEHYLTTKLTHEVELTATTAYAARQVIARLNLRGLGELPDDATVQLTLAPAGAQRPRVTRKIANLTSYGKAGAALNAAKLKPGDYDLTALVMAGGKPFGRPATVTVTWPEPPQWPLSDPHIRVLNNLVSELRNVSDISQDTTIQFTNPRDGWVFFASTASGARGRITVTVPAAGELATVIEQRPGQEPVAEAMRRLPAGKYDLIISCAAGAKVNNLVARAIPEIGYCRVDCGPQLTPYGPTDWPFLEKHVLPHINLAVSRGVDDREKWLAWEREGKRWIVSTPLPGIGQTDGVSTDEVFDAWVSGSNMDEPLLDGMIVDEFGAGDDPIWQSWHEALRRVRDDPRFADKVYYPYCGSLYGAKASREFAQTCLDEGWAIALERYLPEQHTELDARAAIQGPLITTVQEWAKVQPEIVPHLLIVTGFLISTPPESCNIDPAVDYKAFMDLQMNLIANDPALFGLYGVTSYLSAYSEEEIIRWMARLYRHYCIEGRGDRLTDYYELTHLENPDFDDGLDGWQVEAAAPGSVTTGSMPQLSFLQGRYPATRRGENFALLRRDDAKPNRVTQVARGLKPGQTYSVKMISADYGDLRKGVSNARVLPVRLEVQGVDLIAEHSFQHPFRSCYSHVVGPFNADHPAGFNIHNITFRARSRAATVVISDDVKGGEAGQEIICNFLELQPYYEGE
ncbi:MAG TPA: LamG domain-containing protein [Armatimonadota bacterium]|nr:LamG domain-containing protein [Armatimonadota bacterium]